MLKQNITIQKDTCKPRNPVLLWLLNIFIVIIKLVKIELYMNRYKITENSRGYEMPVLSFVEKFRSFIERMKQTA